MNLSLLVRKSLAEFFGTFLLVFIGLGTVYFASDANTLTVALAFGLAVTAGIFALGHISGGHFNPAVSTAMLIDKRLTLKEFAVYVISQFAGALFGLALLLVASPEVSDFVAPNTNVVIILFEMFVTYVFVYVILAVSQRKLFASHVAIIVGLTLTALILVSAAVTGAALNPAVIFAALLMNQGLGTYFAYLVGTILGAVLAALTYKVLKFKDDQTVE
jgi:aquaporin Z